MFSASCLVFALSLVAVNCQQSCQDIDTSACVLLQKQQPDLCSNAAIAESACKRYCNLCLLECYQCTYSLADNTTDCNTTQVCQTGQVCMKKELNSIVDGHHEYEMTCESKATCDGTGLNINFVGKRDIHTRDVSVSCCTTDLCNAPVMPTTPPPTKPPTTVFTVQGCAKDMIIMVDESISMRRIESTVMQFLKSLISSLNIGPSASLVSMATFADDVTDRWDLDTYTDKQALLNALGRVRFQGGSGDNTVAMSYLVNKATSPKNGDRVGVPDTVIFITDDTSHRAFQTTLLASSLDRLSNDIITIGIGAAATSSEIDKIATDAGHSFHLRGANALLGLAPKILALACQ